MVVQDNVASEENRNFSCLYSTCDILRVGYISHNLTNDEVNKNLSNKFIGGKKVVLGAIAPLCPFLTTCLVKIDL